LPGTPAAIDPKPVLFQKPIEHAPGEGAMRAAALKREVDQDWGSFCRSQVRKLR